MRRPPTSAAAPRLTLALVLALAIHAAPLPPAPVTAAATAAVEPAELKAAFLVNFARYTEWPAGRFEHAASPLVVAVIGDPEVAEELAEIAGRAGPIGGHPLEVRSMPLSPPESWRRSRMLEELREAHVVYLGPEAADGTRELLRDLAGVPVLTVGDVPGFAAAGGMIGLRRDRRRLVFDANPEAIKAGGIAVSARVLKLAQFVSTGEGG